MDFWFESHLEVRTYADVQNFEQVPLERRELPQHVYQVIESAANRFGEAVAISYFEDGEHYENKLEWTYSELLRQVTQTANFLRSNGVGRDDAVGLLLPNIPDAQAFLWGAATAGIACPINYMLEASQIASILKSSKCRVLVVLGTDSRFDIWEKVPTLLELVPELQRVVQVPPSVDWEQSAHEADIHRKVISAHAARDFDGEQLSFELAGETSIAAFFHTGGTTGKPKLAIHSHRNQIVNAWLQSRMLAMSRGHVRLCGLPIFHVNGALANGLTLFCGGATLVLSGVRGYRDPAVMRNFWNVIEHYKTNSFAAVPTMLISIMQVPVDGADISSLEFARCGTAPLSWQVAREFTQLTSVELIEGYGLSEGTSISAMNPRYGEKRVGSVGFRVPYQEMKIVRLDADGKISGDCIQGELGTVVIRGPNVISGYLEANDNESAFLADGWYNTGDLGREDADGYFWLTGRTKDLIIRGGHNIDPGMIDQVLGAHPAVAYVAAVGSPDRYTGEMPVAYVTLKPGHHVISEQLLQYAAQNIPERAAVPKAIYIIKEMPVTAVGKIYKPALRQLAMREGYISALGGMIAAYNLRVEIELTNDRPLIKIDSINISPTLHKEVTYFVGQALKTFTLDHELTFINTFGDRPA